MLHAAYDIVGVQSVRSIKASAHLQCWSGGDGRRKRRYSPLTTHHSPLNTIQYCSLLTTHYWLATHYSPLAVHYAYSLRIPISPLRTTHTYSSRVTAHCPRRATYSHYTTRQSLIANHHSTVYHVLTLGYLLVLHVHLHV